MSAATEYYGYLLSQGYGEHQLKKFADYAKRAERGEISHNQAYRMACKAGFSNMNEEQAGTVCEEIRQTQGIEAYTECITNKMSEKKSFGDWMETAKREGWIDKGLNIIDDLVSNDGRLEPIEYSEQNEGKLDPYKNEPKRNNSKPLYVFGALIIIGVGISIYYSNKKK